MPTPTTAQHQPSPAAQTVNAERKRASEISALGRNFATPAEDVATAIEEGTTVDEFQRSILVSMASKAAPVIRGRMSLPSVAPAERSYSLSRVAQAQVTGDWSRAGFEREESQELQNQLGRSASGTYVPTAAFAGRALVTTSTASSLNQTAPVQPVVS